MSNRSDKLYITDIRESIKKIELYIRGLKFEDFRKDSRTIDAVVRNLEIIGEAAKNISKEVKSANSQIPWKEMTSLRNKVSHEYFGVDMDTLWETATVDLPELLSMLRHL